ncbi:hypothetical protein [Streptomyces sp. NPDC060031]|uniref:hypothetical protein n=1 Tax=Streptomyces sp. NPDC060031 TaxID=3347043 RepID=UPI0036A699AE
MAEPLPQPRQQVEDPGRVHEEARPGARPVDVLMDLITDDLFRMPALELAERRAARGRPVWAYQFKLPTSRTTMALDSVTTAVDDPAGYWRRLHQAAS